MGVYPEGWGEHRFRFVEWHSALIGDPVKRLRYLRQATGQSWGTFTRRSPRRSRARFVVLVCAFFALPSPPNYDASLPVSWRRLPALYQPRRSEPIPEVWLVETSAGVETYSNGLRVEGGLEVPNRPRSYRALRRGRGGTMIWEAGTEPAGIVYHATESHIVEFKAGRNHALQAASLGLLDYVRRRRSYHFVVDRFGRVHRVVLESDAADHAGWSVWADRDRVYLNVNDSFLAIALETRNDGTGALPPVTAAQIHAARVLTEMLRGRYHIRPENCVTHAQVSVNPANRRIAYHTDWATHLPFDQLGLPDNYAQPLPSIFLFGFGFDPLLDDPRGPGLWKGLRAAEARIRQEASDRESAPGPYRALLQRQYKDFVQALDSLSAEKESVYEREK